MQAEARLGEVMRVLADPTRRILFERICRSGEIAAGALTSDVCISQPAVSQHLRALKHAGLVEDERHGRSIRYRANPRGLAPLVDWLAHYGAFWRERYAHLETLLKELDHAG